MTPIDTSALRASQEVATDRALAKAYRLLSQASPLQDAPWMSRLVADVVDSTIAEFAAPALLDELDRLRGQVARVEALDAPRYAVNPETQDYECAILESDITQALAIPAEGGE